MMRHADNHYEKSLITHLRLVTAIFFLACLIIPNSLASSIGAQNDNAVFWLTLDNNMTSGSTLIDSANNLNFTIQTGTTNVTGYVRQARDFEQTSSEYVNAGAGMDGEEARSIVFWMKPEQEFSSGTARQVPLQVNTSNANTQVVITGDHLTCTREVISITNDGTKGTCYNETVLNDTQWYHIAWIWNSSSAKYSFYLDGVQQITRSATGDSDLLSVYSPQIGRRTAGQYFDGVIDEISIYNVSLSQAELLQLVDNNTLSVSYPFSTTPPVAPSDLVVNIADLYDSTSIAGITVTISNATYSASNTTDSSGNAKFFGTTGNYTVNTTDTAGRYFDTVFPTLGVTGSTNNYEIVGSFVTLQVQDLANNTLSTFNMTSGSQTNTTTTNSLRLVLRPNATNTISTDIASHYSISPTITTGLQDTNTYTINNAYQAIVAITATNYSSGSPITTFSFNYTGANNGSGTTTNNTGYFKALWDDYNITLDASTFALQSEVYTFANVTHNISFNLLTTNTFNFFVYDEISNNLLNNVFYLSIISESFTQNYTTVNGTLTVELLTPGEYTIRYYSSNYPERDYITTLVDRTYTNITLYALSTGNTTTSLVSVVDTTTNVVENATVKLLRFYTSCNCYEIVEAAKTGSNGEAFFNVDAYDGHYKWSVDYLGINRFVSTSPENLIPNSDGVVLRTITINLGDAFYESYRAISSVGHSFAWNNATETMSFTWSDPSGLVVEGCLEAEYLDGVRYTQQGKTCQSGSTGSILLNLPNSSTRKYKYNAFVHTSTTYSTYSLYSGYLEIARKFNFGGLGVLMGGILIFGIGLMFAYSAIAAIVLTVVSMIGMSLLGIVPLTTTFVMGLATLGVGTIAYLMRS